jgi:hypothetical protein
MDGLLEEEGQWSGLSVVSSSGGSIDRVCAQ